MNTSTTNIAPTQETQTPFFNTTSFEISSSKWGSWNWFKSPNYTSSLDPKASYIPSFSTKKECELPTTADSYGNTIYNCFTKATNGGTPSQDCLTVIEKEGHNLLNMLDNFANITNTFEKTHYYKIPVATALKNPSEMSSIATIAATVAVIIFLGFTLRRCF